MTNEELIARGKRIAESGKHAPKPDPFGTTGAHRVVDKPPHLGEWFDDDERSGHMPDDPHLLGAHDELQALNNHPVNNGVTLPAAAAGETPADDLETRIGYRLDWLRITREAKRRLDDEEHPPAVPPPVKNLAELLDEPDAPIRYTIDQLAPAEGRIVLSAQYKAGKTITVGNLLRALADGDPFLGRFEPASGHRIALIDDELSERMLRSWLRDQQIRNTSAVVDVASLRGRISAFNLLNDRCREQWSARLADLGATFVVLDCLRPILDALGLDEHREAGRFLVPFDAMLADAGVTDALIVHHMGHGAERARGDSRIEDWPDVIWRIVREKPDDPSSPRFFHAIGRDVSVPEGRLDFDTRTRRLTYASGSRKDSKAEAAKVAVVEWLAGRELRGEPAVSKNAIETAFKDGDHPQRAIRDGLAAAVKDGLVVVEGGDRNGVAKLHRIANPCSECGLPVSGGTDRHLSCPEKAEELAL
ncbi:hypothetical protein MSAS_22070 [Mycobacterium saskatchewanense]|uniref:AAA family ATPase n=1 Tax=Mycobacterium saskatchewanense TaxID=220927 RepID=A0AAJ3NPK0_9MYCO|nr:AAA family ATPase [Mycobacterium saskatchewanense]ORW70673.1 hypothetical protein AWC23_16470 [Mycobacterium saskatchewanense]BBX63033.1 hypothetical protein MSAS_22070 [Mycobacterium saskatchewanense]